MCIMLCEKLLLLLFRVKDHLGMLNRVCVAPQVQVIQRALDDVAPQVQVIQRANRLETNQMRYPVLQFVLLRRTELRCKSEVCRSGYRIRCAAIHLRLLCTRSQGSG